MEDYEYDEYAKQFEEACQRIAPQRRMRVWRWAEARRRPPVPGSLEEMRAITHPNYLILELQLTVDDKEYSGATDANIMQWVLMPEHRHEIAWTCVRYLIRQIAYSLVE